MNVIKKFTGDVAACINSEKSIWLDNLGVVPKFVFYSNSALNDAVNEQLISLNHYPGMWTTTPIDSTLPDSQIKAKISAIQNGVVVLDDFAQSNFGASSLEWLYNQSTSFVDLKTCYSVASQWWSNCSELVLPPGHSGPADPPKSTPTFSGSNRLEWFF
jgi:hypothetical protein